MKRKFMALLAVLLLILPVAAMAQSAVVDGGSVNMRTEPGEGAAVIGRFVSGTRLEVLGDAGSGWSRVSIGSGKGSVTGYMMTKYLQPSSAVDARESRSVASPYGTQSVVLRDRPSNSYNAVAMLMVGETVTVIGTNGDFCFVQTADSSVGCLLGSELK